MTKSVDGFGDYYIRDDGSVFSLKKHGGNTVPHKLKPGKDRGGYHLVILCKNGSRKTSKVHRLVAVAFIPNPENKPTVNHKNGIKTDNRIDNLEWATYSENARHSFRKLGRKSNKNMLGKMGSKCPTSRGVIQFDLNGNEVARFGSMMEAERSGFCNVCISACCSGKHKTHAGFRWKYSIPMENNGGDGMLPGFVE